MATNPEHLAKWSAMDDTPGKDGKKIMSVHVARYKKGISFSEILNDTHNEFHPGPPTQGKAYKALLAAEMEAKPTGNGAVGAAHFINNALRLERDQCVFP